MFAKYTRLLALAGLCVLWLARLSFAQYTTTSLSGTVLDPSGAPVTGADITVEGMDNGLHLAGTSGDAGTFSFPCLTGWTLSDTSTKARLREVYSDRSQSGNRTARQRAGQASDRKLVSRGFGIRGHGAHQYGVRNGRTARQPEENPGSAARWTPAPGPSLPHCRRSE